jgi:hypothetical protein
VKIQCALTVCRDLARLFVSVEIQFCRNRAEYVLRLSFLDLGAALGIAEVVSEVESAESGRRKSFVSTNFRKAPGKTREPMIFVAIHLCNLRGPETDFVFRLDFSAIFSIRRARRISISNFHRLGVHPTDEPRNT